MAVLSVGVAEAAARDFGLGRTDRLVAQLIATNKLAQGGLERAMQVAAESDERLEVVLTRLGLVSERDLAGAIAAAFGFAFTGAADFPAHAVLGDRLKRSFLHGVRAMPLGLEDGRLRVAMVDPLDDYAVRALRFAVEMPLDVKIVHASDFEAALVRLYGADEGGSPAAAASLGAGLSDDIDRISDQASDAPIVRLVNTLIARAVEMRASDIHVEPMENDLIVRYRVDGVLRRGEILPKGMAPAIASRVKVMAKLNIAERRLAQDGRITLAVRGTDIEFRVATTPTVHGESVVLRLLDRSRLTLDFPILGFEDGLIAAVRRLTEQPHGIVLVTGPTGSGKTTTLYAALSGLNTEERKILTIEDPVEYRLSGINQVQVKPQIGLTFANALRSFLRHDPDVMMIGEIRDLETARTAAQAALTGHLILSTLHTNDAASAVVRLTDMGLEDYLLTATLNGVVAQRLVRTLCTACRRARPVGAETAARLGLAVLANDAAPQLWRAVGCEACGGTGYSGRTTIAEVLVATEDLRDAVMRRSGATELREIACRAGMEPMRINGFRKALAGTTTLDEVLRVTLETV